MNNNIHHKLILNYNSNGWVIIKNFFNKREINKVKNQLLNKISKSKDNGHFYFEKIRHSAHLFQCHMDTKHILLFLICKTI